MIQAQVFIKLLRQAIIKHSSNTDQQVLVKQARRVFEICSFLRR